MVLKTEATIVNQRLLINGCIAGIVEKPKIIYTAAQGITAE
jgi:hypothetical protein